MNIKRRTSNFTHTERILLINLIEKHKHVIENKKTDAAAIREKEIYWERISAIYNSAGVGVYRNVSSLRGCWDNLKKKTRKLIIDGDALVQIPEDSIFTRIKEIMSHPTDGTSCNFDSNISNSDFTEVATNAEFESTAEEDMASAAEPYTEVNESNWTIWNPRTLETPVNVELLSSEDSPVPIEFISPIVSTSAPDAERKRKRVRTKDNKNPFAALATSKKELADMVKMDFTEKKEIEMKILKNQLEKSNIELETAKVELQIKKAILNGTLPPPLQ